MKKFTIIILGLMVGYASAEGTKIGGNPQDNWADKAVDTLANPINDALKIAKETGPELACASLAQLGEGISVALITDENRKLARAMCCGSLNYFGTYKAKQDHPKAAAALCQGGQDPLLYLAGAVASVVSQKAGQKKACEDANVAFEKQLKSLSTPKTKVKYKPLIAHPKNETKAEKAAIDKQNEEITKANKLLEEAAIEAEVSAGNKYIEDAHKLQGQLCGACKGYWSSNPSEAMNCEDADIPTSSSGSSNDGLPDYSSKSPSLEDLSKPTLPPTGGVALPGLTPLPKLTDLKL